jgi:peptide-methionine (R)-S-oxide reductase
MKRFLMRILVCLAATTVLCGTIALAAAGQGTARDSKKKTADAAEKKTADADETSPAKSGAAIDLGSGERGGVDSPTKDLTATDDAANPAKTAKTKNKAEPEFVRKTDAEWRKILTKPQYMVTRQKATEPAFSGKYATGHYRGIFVCVCCEAKLFDAKNKFDSGTGWPSFDWPATNKSIVREMDYSASEPRVEANCRRCGAHLGHIFDDGPTVTGLRFCINSLAIKLEIADSDSPSDKATSPASSRTGAKSRAKPKTTSKPKSKAKAKQPRGDVQSTPSASGDDRLSEAGR